MLSLQVNVTLTAPLFQPLAGGAGEAKPEITGGVLSMLTVWLADEELPARSVQVALTDWLAPSVETVRLTVDWPAMLSLQSHVMVTSVLYQPAKFAGGLLCSVITGGVWSTLIGPHCAVEVFPT